MNDSPDTFAARARRWVASSIVATFVVAGSLGGVAAYAEESVTEPGTTVETESVVEPTSEPAAPEQSAPVETPAAPEETAPVAPEVPTAPAEAQDDTVVPESTTPAARTSALALTAQPGETEWTVTGSNGQVVSWFLPTEVVAGEDITLRGTGWLTTDGTQGSGMSVLINQPAGASPTNGVGVNTTRSVVSEVNGAVLADKRLHAQVKADVDGNWTVTIPFPTPENSSLDENTAWKAGDVHGIRILGGSAVSGDVTRSAWGTFTVVASGGTEEPSLDPRIVSDLPTTASAPLRSAGNDPAGDPEFRQTLVVEGAPEGATVQWFRKYGNAAATTNFTSIVSSATGFGFVVSNDASDGRLSSTLTYQLNTGQYYAARYNNANGMQWYAVVTWTEAGVERTLTSATTTWTALVDPPTVASHPANAEVRQGATATFTAADSDGFGAAYQWQTSIDGDEWSNVDGGTASTLSVPTGDFAPGSRLYRAVITNNSGSVNTDSATLTVLASDVAPTVLTSPQDVELSPLSTSARFAASADDVATSVQWQVRLPDGDWTDIEGEQTLMMFAGAAYSSVLLFFEGEDENAVHGAQYRAVFANGAGTATTQSATLTVRQGTIEITETTAERGATIHLSASGLPADQPVTVRYFDSVSMATDLEIPAGTRTSQTGTLTDVPVRLAVSANGDGNIPFAGLLPLGNVRLAVTAGTLAFGSDPIEIVATPGAVAPTITVQPEEKTFAIGEQYSYSVTIADNPGPVYVRWGWKVNTSSQEVANSGVGTRDGNTFSYVSNLVGGLTAANNGQAAVAYIYTAAGLVTTEVVPIRVAAAAAPAVTTQPSSQVSAPGGEVTFTVAGTGVSTPTVQWQKREPLADDYSDIAGATSLTLRVSDVTATDNGTAFRAVLTNQAGSARSNAALLTVTSNAAAPVVTAHPQPVSVEAGNTATFTAGASGAPTPSVQWWSRTGSDDWTIVAGANATTLTIAGTTTAQSGRLYKAVFTNTAGSVESDSAELSVVAAATERTYTVTDGAGRDVTYTVPTVLEPGADIVVSGTNWRVQDGSKGSVFSVLIDATFSGDPNTLYTKRDITNPVTGTTSSDKRLHAIVEADATGAWTATIPYPTAQNSSAGDTTPAWTAGTIHQIRFLSGTLETRTPDVTRSFNANFTIEGEAANGPSDPPTWAHETVTFTDPASNKVATAWVEKDVEAGDDSTIRIKGTGWTNQAGTGASTVAIKLNRGEGQQYTRSGAGIVQHPSATGDDTIWALLAPSNPQNHSNVIVISADGNFEIELDAPDGLTPGQYLSVLFQSGRFDSADVLRTITTGFLTVGGAPYTGGGTSEEVTCVPTSFAPTLTIENPQVGLGGKLHVTGTGWCHPGENRGGSVIAFKIDEGAYSRLNTDIHQNLTIWTVATANAADGTLDFEIQLPDGTTSGANGSSPAFTQGSHTLRLLTGSLKSGDLVRTLLSTEFVVGDYQPNGAPDPLDASTLTTSNTNGVSVTKSATALTVTVPGAVEGDWIFLTPYATDGSPRYPWLGTWFRANAQGVVTAPLGGATLPVGTLKVAVQSGNQGELGTLLGWGTVKVEAPPTPDAGAGTGTISVPRASAPANARPVYTLANRSAGAQSPVPDNVPDAPFDDDSGLTAGNAGGITGVQDGTIVTITIPGNEPGDWVYLYAYSTPIAVGWIQVDENRQVRVDVAALPAGAHKIAVLDEDGALIGWTSATVSETETQATETEVEVSGDPDSDVQASAPLSTGGGLSAADWWLLGGGLVAVLVAIAIALAVASRRRALAAAQGEIDA